jgi:hypothetical protein
VIEGSRNGLLAGTAAWIHRVVTLSRHTWGEDNKETLFVVSNLGEPEKLMRIVPHRSKARPKAYLTLSDLRTCVD